MIGIIDNEYFIELLRVNFNPFDSLLVDYKDINTYGLDKDTD